MLRAALSAACLGAASLGLAAPSHAQQEFGFSLGEPAGQAQAQTPLLRTIDDERLYRESRFGQRVAAEIEQASRALEAENDVLLEELTAREEELTVLRNTLTLEEFRAAAAAFDRRAEEIRRSQAEKRQRLVQFEEAERRRFFGLIPSILQDVLVRAGGQILIDARAVVIGIPGLDMTDDSIEALDAEIGDGGAAPFPLSIP